jgi:hypothetical protein
VVAVGAAAGAVAHDATSKVNAIRQTAVIQIVLLLIHLSPFYISVQKAVTRAKKVFLGPLC